VTLLLVAVAGAIGAPCRLLLDQWVARRHGGRFPLGTWLVNLSGSLLLGFVTGLALYQGLGHWPKAFIGTGFCGAYTTFSTFAYETVHLAEDGAVSSAVMYLMTSLVVGLLAAGAGMALAWAL
jgi:fluoride exporter